MEPGFDKTLTEGWAKEDDLKQELAQFGIKSDDEFDNRDEIDTETAKNIGDTAIEGVEA